MGVAVTSTSSEPACLGPTGPVAWGCAVLGKSPELSEPIFSLCVSGDNPTASEIRQGTGRLLQEMLKSADTLGVWETLPTVSTCTVSVTAEGTQLRGGLGDEAGDGHAEAPTRSESAGETPHPHPKPTPVSPPSENSNTHWPEIRTQT